MATESARLQSKPAGVKGTTVGLVANGSAGSWDVAVDETVTGADKWFIQIEGRSFYVYFQIAGPQSVNDMLDFLDARKATNVCSPTASRQNCEMRVGSFSRTPVSFAWDEEGGRLYIRVGGAGECNAIFTIANSELPDFADALRQVRDDLADDGPVTAP